MLALTEANFKSHANNLRANSASSALPPRRGAETPDAVLVAAIARGDRRAMEQLYARHHVRVYRFAARLSGNADLAEDIVSEVFLDVWRQSGTFKGNSQISTWLFAIARNKSVSAVRRRIDAPLDQRACEIEDLSDDPEGALEQQDRRVVIRRCLAQLPAAQREVLDLAYYHEKSVDEVARIVGVPAGTVKTRMFYARRRMEELLAGEGVRAA